MRIPQTYVQRGKAILHGAQLFFIFLVGVLVLTVLVKDGGSDARVGYAFAMCFFSIPALIYQVMVPMWTRAWRFANAYAYAAIDISFTVLWLAAFAALADWMSDGIKKGEKDREKSDEDGKSKSDSKSGCAAFGYGNETRCTVASAGVGMGVIVCLLFLTTSTISVYGILKFRKTGVLPGHEYEDEIKTSSRPKYEDPNKEAWNTDIRDLENHRRSHGDYEVDGDDQRRKYGQSLDDDEDHVGLLDDSRPIGLNETHHNVAPLQGPLSFEDSSYNAHQQGSDHGNAANRATLGSRPSHHDMHKPSSRIEFPPANY